MTGELPISQSVAVFLGVSGFDWLKDGRADPLFALLVALAAGISIFLYRKLKRP